MKEKLERVEMIDIITGHRYPQQEDSNFKDFFFIDKYVQKIDEQLFDETLKKDEQGLSEVAYDVRNFDKTIKLMKNYILTTHGLCYVDKFKPLELSIEEKEMQEKKKVLLENDSILFNIKLANTCVLSRIDKPINGNKRKGKVQFYSSEQDVPVYITDDGKAINLLDTKKVYDILEYQVDKKRMHILFGITLTDKQYDELSLDILSGKQKEYINGYSEISCLTIDKVLMFCNKELKEIVTNLKKILSENNQKKLLK